MGGVADQELGVRTELRGEEGILESELGWWLVPEVLFLSFYQFELLELFLILPQLFRP